MLSKVQKRGINVMIVVFMSGLGATSYIPTAYAESSAEVQENQVTNSLSKLEVEGLDLDQPFSTDTKEYSAVVENNVQTVSLLIESSKPDSVITINGQSVTSGTPISLSLQTGENPFLIELNDGNSTNTYTLTITRKQSTNNLLQAINLSTGELSPAFSPAINDYTIQVPNTTSVISITPISEVKTSKMKVNDNLVSAGTVSVQLPVGKSDILIVVEAENGETKTYTLHVIRASDSTINKGTANSSQSSRNNSFMSSSQQQTTDTVQKVTKATLTTLTVSEGIWDSEFTSNEYTYHVSVPHDAKTITMNPTATYSSATILIEGNRSNTIQLEDDNKTVISVVVKYDDSDRKTYVIVFDRQS